MFKRIIIVVLALVGTAACTNNSENDITTTTTANHTQTTVINSVYTKEFCDSMSKEIGNLFEQYAAALQDSSVGVNTAVTTGRQLVELGNTFLDVCGQYYSSEVVGDLRIQLDDLEETLDSVER